MFFGIINSWGRTLINFNEAIVIAFDPIAPWRFPSLLASLRTEVSWHNYAHFPLWSNNNFGRNYFARWLRNFAESARGRERGGTGNTGGTAQSLGSIRYGSLVNTSQQQGLRVRPIDKINNEILKCSTWNWKLKTGNGKRDELTVTREQQQQQQHVPNGTYV